MEVSVTLVEVSEPLYTGLNRDTETKSRRDNYSLRFRSQKQRAGEITVPSVFVLDVVRARVCAILVCDIGKVNGRRGRNAHLRS